MKKCLKKSMIYFCVIVLALVIIQPICFAEEDKDHGTFEGYYNTDLKAYFVTSSGKMIPFASEVFSPITKSTLYNIPENTVLYDSDKTMVSIFGENELVVLSFCDSTHIRTIIMFGPLW